MGKSSDLAPAKDNSGSLPTTPLVEGASSISMHRPSQHQNDHYNTLSSAHRQQYFDDDDDDNGNGDDDLPPLYSNHDPAIAPADPLLPIPALEISPHQRSAKDGITYYIDKRLDTDPLFLQDQLAILAQYPPRPMCRIRGTHTETIRRGDKDENQTVVDFDLEIDLTSLLYVHTSTAQQVQPQKKATTVGNFEKVHRGTVFATRAPGFGGSGGGSAETGTPSLTEWCHRYCASAAGLKQFSLERRVTGYNFDLLTNKLTNLIRTTNYLGHISVTFPVHDARVEIYNDCATSRWRLTRWIQVLAYVTLVFLLTWPWLAFRTKRWATVYVAWPLREEATGRYTSMSEEVWYNMWARAIQDAAVARRQGALDQGDMQRANLLGGNPPPLPEGGTGSWAGAIQAGVEAMARVNRSFGWGADTRRGRMSRLSGLPNLGRRG